MNNSILTKIRSIQRRILDWVVAHHPGLALDKRAEFFVKIFEKNLEPGSRILDVGGGWGFYAEPLQRRGHRCVVLDVVEPAVQNAPVVVYSGDEPMPFPDQSFDASMLITVLHHVEDPEFMLQEITRVTRRHLIVVEDTYHHALGKFWTKTRDQLYNFEFFGHPGNFKKTDEWIEWFEQRGFKLADIESVYTWLSGLRILNTVFVFEVPEYSNRELSFPAKAGNLVGSPEQVGG